ncbi:lysM and putative peptidoglycan-binding domain-containing protein 1 isoform X4 [Siniperca chuatsi]|uniref:lysM and putative peptidoglycan-binding domain-containing protein 1 isoform X4 n=1 Tax=Siniperca chuatsi TaxID=119488 RepID=UPI001CE02AEE|nr:lysM and putative peptidoglycan-binding domain-containing protein 1 isoform X4 [Siniperca chuatsi]
MCIVYSNCLVCSACDVSLNTAAMAKYGSRRENINNILNFSSICLRDKMEQIKRANRMYTNDSIFLKKSLSIPVLSDLDHCSNGVDLVLEDSEEGRAEKKQDDGKERASDLTPADFLKRLDGLISQSKQAAVKRCQEADKSLIDDITFFVVANKQDRSFQWVAALEAACTSRTSDWRPLTRSQSVISSSRMQQQQAAHGAVPLTITKLTKKLRDREDEIFQL